MDEGEKSSEPFKLELSPLHSPLRVGQWYSLQVSLKRGTLPTTHTGQLKIEAYQEDNKESRQLVIKDPYKLDSEGSATIIFKLTEPTKVVDSKPKKTIIRVSLYETQEETSPVLAFIETHPLIVFKFGLKVLESHSSSYIFYKDKGGKDQGIELEIKLVDEFDNLVVDKDILLMPILLYEGGSKVSDQSILTMSNDKTALRLNHGKTQLKFRINQVSTKHCNQKFCVLITQAVRENDFPEVAPAISVPVDVRSKKNKRPNQQLIPGITGLSSGSNETDNNPAKRPRGKENLFLRFVPSDKEINVGLSEVQRSAAMLETNDVSATSVIGPILNSGEMYSNSIRLVDEWIKDTMLKMKEEIRWRQSGINRDTGEPLYEIRNPNLVIDRLLSSYDRISLALHNLTRLRHLLDAFIANPGIATRAIHIKNEGSNDTSQISTHTGGISQMTSLSSSLDIAMNTHPKYLKPEAFLVNLRSASGESMDSHIESVVSDKTNQDESKQLDDSRMDEGEEDSNKGIAAAEAGYDMLDMLATVANRNVQEILGSGRKSASGEDDKRLSKDLKSSSDSATKTVRHAQFENPIPDQITNDNFNVTLIVTEYVTVDNVIQGFPGLKFDTNGALELLGFYKIVADKHNIQNFDENRIKEIGPTNSVVVTNHLLKQTLSKEDDCEGQLCAVMDVIIKKDQPHDVRIELWRYYHESKPFQQPKVLHDKKLALKFQHWNPSVHSETKKQKIEKFATGKINSTVGLVKQKANAADILAKTAQRLVTCNVFGLNV